MKRFSEFKSSIYAFIACILLTLITSHLLNKKNDQTIFFEKSAKLKQIEEQFKFNLEQQLFLYQWMSNIWISSDLTQAHKWQQQAAQISQQYDFIDGLYWVNNKFVIEWVQPLISNQNLIGYEFENSSSLLQKFKKLESEKSWFSYPLPNLKTIQDTLLISVSVKDQDKFLGSMSALINLKKLNASLISSAYDDGFIVSISVKPISTAPHQIIFERVILDNQWYFSIMPTPKKLSNKANTEANWVLLVGFILSLFFASFVRFNKLTRRYSKHLNKVNQNLKLQIHKTQQTEEALIKNAKTDVLTTLPNRFAFEELLIEKLANKINRDVAVILIGLDNFSDINTLLGHKVGDQLLLKATSRIQKLCTSDSFLCRFGGDEFAIFIDDADCNITISRLVNRLLCLLEVKFKIDGYEFHTSASIGFTIENIATTSEMLLLQHVDSALTQAKREGKNQICRYNSHLDSLIADRISLLKSLRNAIQNQEFVLYYQPKINYKTKKYIGVEALIRWINPTTGEIKTPDEFIPLAEESGIIINLGKWIIETACQQLKLWHEMGFNHLTMAINISGRQIESDDLYQTIRTEYLKQNFSAACLQLELTEQVFIENVKHNESVMRQIVDLGCSLAIDDFGVGYSSLTYLKQFPVDTLKIDKSFVQQLPSSADDLAIVEAVIDLAHNLGIDIIAEGVESQAQAEFLLAKDCKILQGYLFSKPVSADTLTQAFLNDENWS
ncbi:putative bifunctional diguanylate cyclase/phosphodiesterase [Catenovulum maritimum]|uniref:putative bifunctional diguanylate cyclase/phosphodiesterase n=1 Tax=Catenovulum maritimum TaxID=1513271 RepID=UPI000660D132|nr:bifunctional diguanylate cyclase/phosphodiesterase [Catenovulum maritimum]